MNSFPRGVLVSLFVHSAIIAALLFAPERTVQLEPAPPPPRVIFQQPQAPKVPKGNAPAQALPPRVKQRRRWMAPPHEVPARAAETPVVETAEAPGPAGGPIGSPEGAVGGTGAVIGLESVGPAEFVEGKMTPPQRLSGPDPRYTPQALEHEVEGTMQVRCVVDLEGSVRECRIVKSLPYMDREVVRALESRRYAPATLDGRPIEVEYIFRVTLHLPN